MRLPGLGDFDARTWASTVRLSSTRSTSTSTWPPVSLTPKKRALSTRVSFITSRSPGLQLVDDVGELAVDDLVAIEVQQARRATVRQRQLRDALGGQVEVEIG